MIKIPGICQLRVVSHAGYVKLKLFLKQNYKISWQTNNGRNRRSLRVVNGKKLYGPPVKLKNYDSLNNTDWSSLESTLPPKWLARFEEKNLTKNVPPGWYARAIKKGHKLRKMKRHYHNGELLNLRVTLPQTKHRMRIIKLQPAVKVL